MRLTNVLCFINSRPKFPKGNIFFGKNRLVKPVNDLGKAIEKEKFKIEERNMFLLRHPYLSIQEEAGHVQHLNKREEYIKRKKTERFTKFSKHVKLTHHLCDLRTNESWDN